MSQAKHELLQLSSWIGSVVGDVGMGGEKRQGTLEGPCRDLLRFSPSPWASPFLSGGDVYETSSWCVITTYRVLPRLRASGWNKKGKSNCSDPTAHGLGDLRPPARSFSPPSSNNLGVGLVPPRFADFVMTRQTEQTLAALTIGGDSAASSPAPDSASIKSFKSSGPSPIETLHPHRPTLPPPSQHTILPLIPITLQTKPAPFHATPAPQTIHIPTSEISCARENPSGGTWGATLTLTTSLTPGESATLPEGATFDALLARLDARFIILPLVSHARTGHGLRVAVNAERVVRIVPWAGSEKWATVFVRACGLHAKAGKPEVEGFEVGMEVGEVLRRFDADFYGVGGV
ncbi:hypothetical protein BDK51DRAFT_46938 [Blyttiomyces helicus]|uniref:Uncharacterized protein n=1 Tax=Blyttiomyces helicus TaxID=388810 RepID=A0A4V1IQG2_9FUNG|nr:hypothetical protein BDK51DRAFT_46938 [Blyttiomyces helicus]|eukprot:RKO86447.1 hypothetical protein BDK51DRAFT_46938 [Blyttiomyces helicus]